jgi:hypothetical protein
MQVYRFAVIYGTAKSGFIKVFTEKLIWNAWAYFSAGYSYGSASSQRMPL